MEQRHRVHGPVGDGAAIVGHGSIQIVQIVVVGVERVVDLDTEEVIGCRAWVDPGSLRRAGRGGTIKGG